jgi:hypothetical protein
MTRIWQMMLPAAVFAGVKELIRKAVSSDRAELSRRIPGFKEHKSEMVKNQRYLV